MMARSRNIKPGFFQNDLLAEVEPLGRLLFAGLWTIADRAGRLEDRSKRIKAAILPYDECDADALLDQLAACGFVVRYQVASEHYIEVLNFTKHQNPHCKEPESTIPAPGEYGARLVQKLDEHRTGPADSLNLIPEPLNPQPEPLHCSPSASELADDGFTAFWKQYPKKAAKPQALKAWRKIKPGGQQLADLMAGLEQQKSSADWQKDGGRFIPHPSRWLNDRRWEDESKENETQAMPLGSLKHQDYMKGITVDGHF